MMNKNSFNNFSTYLFMMSITVLACVNVAKAQVKFETTDKALKQLYDTAEQKCLKNIKDFGKYKVLVEGATYPNVWLETQPMGGEMYAKRNIEVAKNNQLIFMDHQRADGRLPGMISFERNKIYTHYGWFQGFCFPEPALNLYYWMGRDTAYLKRLYNCLEKFDSYLWKIRDSDGDGCLESWCVYDTGEDNCVRLDGAPLQWGYEFAPNKSLIHEYGPELQEPGKSNTLPVPIESMDVMSYSYSARSVLAKIAVLLNNGKKAFWQDKAREVQAKIKSYLWNPVKSACYDRDPNNEPVDVLLHNNIRCMYYGSFDQQMADEFIEKHLLNPNEFWTNVPLPSIAVNDPAFRNVEINDWSGQPQGLTFQRTIRALENYSHYAEVKRVGDRFIAILKQNFKFTQQYDPFTGKASNTLDGYGPTMLAMLEYISRMYGIHYTNDKIWWSGLNSGKDTTDYEQVINGKKYRLKVDKNRMTGYLDDKVLFTSSPDVRYITDLNGKLLEAVGIDSVTRQVVVTIAKTSRQVKLNIKPNGIYSFNQNK